MTSQTDKAKAKLASLSSSFDDLEAILEPLFAQTLPESVVGLEPIQQAKLQTVLPYLAYDLVFIYLKSRGIDPKTHPVVSELDRVKEYFNKISTAENPPAKRTEMDNGAAQRFIKHAIAQATYGKTTPGDEAPAGPSSSTRVQAKITSKMLERQLYEKKLKEQDAQDSEEVELEVFDGEEEEDKMDVDTPTSRSSKKGKGKAKDVPPAQDQATNSKADTKRRRPAIDPFAGYGDDIPTPIPADPSRSEAATPDPQIRKSKKRALADDPTTPGPASADDSKQSPPAPESGSAKKTKKVKKKSSKKSLTN
ncbi:hypothetical protein DXG03_001527 [Asterophora parasitica]|uniref:Exosome complex protein n=1 Tax=Asterophora parasitica TaxID=117018 RepID=A0A9P7G9U2_9AGAR|nr:hypothetical protein DXG03_001527 [Asterophora parasitica]